jgi:hypothetical protein
MNLIEVCICVGGQVLLLLKLDSIIKYTFVPSVNSL